MSRTLTLAQNRLKRMSPAEINSARAASSIQDGFGLTASMAEQLVSQERLRRARGR